MIDTTVETVVPFGQAARRLPSIRSGKPVSPATLWRWSRDGVLARDGSRVRLETVRIGGASCTSIEALSRFFARLSGEDTAPTPAPTATQQAKAHTRAEATLDAAGI